MTRRIRLGEISGAFGVKGWVRVYSHTRPRENILEYSPWELAHKEKRWSLKVLEGRRQGPSVVASLEGIDTREAAEILRGAKIEIDRTRLPPLEPGEFYWADLVGMDVLDLAGRRFGQVVDMMETGANDVMIVRGEEGREILVPWLRDRVIREVNLAAGEIRVDWDPGY
ncbi:ribosome maturation factor RimM [Methylohalobius crimeensis]|uniref:ribosome maturation factor RimM n=1 Tax=Methylohalobius crimeensis TaxID=244365 RepID=UPI0003B6C9DB|nr:ribosome maturation factor RimM [Methylohalobius crimeensis]